MLKRGITGALRARLARYPAVALIDGFVFEMRIVLQQGSTRIEIPPPPLFQRGGLR